MYLLLNYILESLRLDILVTGASGFVGKHLIEKLSGKKDKILGIDLRIESTDGADGVCFKEIDIKDPDKVANIIKKLKPSRIFHLAAQSSVKNSWQDPIETFRINVFGGINILEAVKKYSPGSKVLVVCTAEEYGDGNLPGKAIKETDKLNPSNPYAISKAALDFFSTTYNKAYGVNIFVSRSFNHIGPGQSERFVCSDFAKQIALIEKGEAEPLLRVGNLGSYRDFLDVRDVVSAYIRIVERAKPGVVYNVCSGRKTKVKKILDILLSLSSRDDIKIEVDSQRLRPIDTDIVYGDNTRLIKDTGWKAFYELEESLKDTLQWWRSKINKENKEVK